MSVFIYRKCSCNWIKPNAFAAAALLFMVILFVILLQFEIKISFYSLIKRYFERLEATVQQFYVVFSHSSLFFFVPFEVW